MADLDAVIRSKPSRGSSPLLLRQQLSVSERRFLGLRTDGARYWQSTRYFYECQHACLHAILSVRCDRRVVASGISDGATGDCDLSRQETTEQNKGPGGVHRENRTFLFNRFNKIETD